jgi:hypothetical protein
MFDDDMAAKYRTQTELARPPPPQQQQWQPGWQSFDTVHHGQHQLPPGTFPTLPPQPFSQPNQAFAYRDRRPSVDSEHEFDTHSIDFGDRRPFEDGRPPSGFDARPQSATHGYDSRSHSGAFDSRPHSANYDNTRAFDDRRSSVDLDSRRQSLGFDSRQQSVEFDDRRFAFVNDGGSSGDGSYRSSSSMEMEYPVR